jgi:hypothetical protein
LKKEQYEGVCRGGGSAGIVPPFCGRQKIFKELYSGLWKVKIKKKAFAVRPCLPCPSSNGQYNHLLILISSMLFSRILRCAP